MQSHLARRKSTRRLAAKRGPYEVRSVMEVVLVLGKPLEKNEGLDSVTRRLASQK